MRGKLVQQPGKPPAVETRDGKLIALDGDEPTRGVLNDKRLAGFDLEAKGRFTAPGRFQVDPIHTRAMFVYQGRQGQAHHLLVRYLLHSHLYARIVLVLPGGDHARSARSRRPWTHEISLARTARTPYVRKPPIIPPPEPWSKAPKWCAWPTPPAKRRWPSCPPPATTPTSIKIGGQNIIWFPPGSPAAFKAKPSALCGVPFLAPWANRLDQDAYWANGKKYVLNPELGNLRRDANQLAIHGLLVFSSAWQVTALEADAQSARVTSRIEFWKHPELMAQFPFAHTIEMTYRLREGALEVETVLRNHSLAPMPVAVGYHPYFVVPDAPRDEWKAHLAARERLVLSDKLVPTGEKRPVTFADPQPLAGTQLDDVFTDLVRENGKSDVLGGRPEAAISVVYGPKYTVAVAYAPKAPGRDFICFEPMTAPTNAFNLAHEGKYDELQSIAPGGEWRESFWIVPSGF